MSIPVAVIGLGGVSANHLTKLARRDDVSVVGVCDLSATVADAVAEKFDVGPVFTDYRDLLANAQPQVVHVATPPHTHGEICRAALESGAHVLVEKPITTTFAEYAELRDLSLALGKMLVENYNYRFGDVVAQALREVREGAIGEVVTVDVIYGVPVGEAGGAYSDPNVPHFAHRMPGGALQNFGTHAAYLALDFMGADFTDVSIWTARLLEGGASDDELRALVRSERACATITLTSRVRPAGCWVIARGSEGTLELDVYNWRKHTDGPGSGISKVTQGLGHGANYIGRTLSLTGRAFIGAHDYYQGLERLMDGLYTAVRTDAEPPVTIAEMDRTNRLMQALFENGVSQ